MSSSYIPACVLVFLSRLLQGQESGINQPIRATRYKEVVWVCDQCTTLIWACDECYTRVPAQPPEVP